MINLQAHNTLDNFHEAVLYEPWVVYVEESDEVYFKAIEENDYFILDVSLLDGDDILK